MVKFKVYKVLYERVYTSLLEVEEPLEYFNQKFEVYLCFQTDHVNLNRKNRFGSSRG